MAKVILRAGKICVTIVLPLMVLVIVLYLVKVITIAQVAGPPAPATWADIDLAEFETMIEKYLSEGQYVQAEALAQNTISRTTSSLAILRGKTALVKAYICSEQFESAVTLTSDLIVQSSTDPNLVEALCEIGDTWRRRDQFDEALIVYQQVTGEFGDNPSAIWAQKNLCRVYLSLQDEQSAQSATDDLIASFAENPAISEAVCGVGDAWLKSGDTTTAIELYDYTAKNYPEGTHSVWAQRKLCAVYLDIKDEESAQIATDELLASFGEHPGISRGVNGVGDAWLKNGDTTRAIGLYEYVVENYPEGSHAIWSQKNLCTYYAAQKNEAAGDASIAALKTIFGEHRYIAKALCEVGDAWRRAGLPDKATDLYRYIAEYYPEDDYALWSWKNILTQLIETGDVEDANALMDFHEGFSDHPRFPLASLHIADVYRKNKRPDEAKAHYQYTIDNWPDSENALYCQMGLAISSLNTSDDEGALYAIGVLLVDYLDDERMGEAVCHVANELYRKGKDPLARQVCQYFLDNRSNPALDIWANAVEVTARVDAADPNVIDNLIADYAGHRRLPQAAFFITERFYNKALDLERTGHGGSAGTYLRKAIKGWETIVARLPETAHVTKEAWQLAGDCYRRLGEHQKAVVCYEHIVKTWPSSKMAWNAQYLIGYSYERLKKGGVVDREEADAIIEAAYAQLLKAYPDCPAAKAARNWLKHNVATGKGGQG